VLPSDTPRGLCVKCLFASILDSGPIDPPQSTHGKAALPRAFSHYELLEQVARGGMGIVYRALQTQINRVVAVKVADGAFAGPDFVKRFRTEAEAVASLDHPNIVPIFEVGECEGQAFFSMKFVEGGSLAQRISDLKCPISNREAAELIATLAQAVHYAHQRGILHRDIKPGNVLLGAHGEPHLTDFGVAKLLAKDSTLTRTMAILGTPSYMSPEQARGEAKQLTTAVDVYGLGAVFYDLLTGHPPFAGGTTMETVLQVVNKRAEATVHHKPAPIRLGNDLPEVPEKNPSARYGSAEALAEDLRSAGCDRSPFSPARSADGSEPRNGRGDIPWPQFFHPSRCWRSP
jgi:serine/threonine-protein kinase